MDNIDCSGSFWYCVDFVDLDRKIMIIVRMLELSVIVEVVVYIDVLLWIQFCI